MNKRKVLFISEATYMNTGYAVYCREVMRRLVNNPELEIAEFASYGNHLDQRVGQIPWKFYGALPMNNEENAVYNSDARNQFGSYKFENVCLNFMPDVVFTLRDIWMDSYVETSPFRPYFHWSYMPTVDREGQDPAWLSTYINCDSVFTYQDWSQEILKKEGGGMINLCGSASPGIDPNLFKPIPNIQQFKNQFFGEKTKIVGTVMRNQKRKLYSDLIHSFKDYKELCKEKGCGDLAKHTKLLIFSSYPDVGWNFPRILRESGVANDVYFVYLCKQQMPDGKQVGCGYSEPKRFAGKLTYCSRCGQLTSGMPNVQIGLTDQALVEIYNLMDLYCQYSFSEGMGMPQVEAASCGVPVMGTNYSSMQDVLPKLNGIPIDVVYKGRETETHAYNGYPNNKDFANKLFDFFIQPASLGRQRGAKAREGVLKHFTWDQTAKKLAAHFSSCPIPNNWNNPPKVFQPNTNIPEIRSNEDFLKWCFVNILGDPSKINSYLHMRMLKDLNYGNTVEYMGGSYFNEASILGSKQNSKTFSRQDVVNELLGMRNRINEWEIKRWNKINTIS